MYHLPVTVRCSNGVQLSFSWTLPLGLRWFPADSQSTSPGAFGKREREGRFFGWWRYPPCVRRPITRASLSSDGQIGRDSWELLHRVILLSEYWNTEYSDTWMFFNTTPSQKDYLFTWCIPDLDKCHIRFILFSANDTYIQVTDEFNHNSLGILCPVKCFHHLLSASSVIIHNYFNHSSNTSYTSAVYFCRTT